MVTKRKLQEWLDTVPADANVSYLTEYNRVQDEDTIRLISIENDKWNQLIEPLGMGYPW